ncbi:MAG: hypothetical protein HY297_04035 [Thaumarchaeota archaeon]|nr:hypothetical protein [Nitrososphaerota archaeon]
MALRKPTQKALVESDFLFGLRSSDLRHDKVTAALKRHKKGDLELTVMSSAVLETRAVMYSRGLRPAESEEAVSLMDTALAAYGVREFLPVRLGDVVVAERLKSQRPDLGFFDSLHAAGSKRLGIPLLTSEGVYQRIGLPVLDLDAL